ALSASAGTRSAGRSAPATSATPTTAKALPMSRTKCELKGPVSGTAAGRRAYQLAGAASIQAALPRLATPSASSTHRQGWRPCAGAMQAPARRPASATGPDRCGPDVSGHPRGGDLHARGGGESRDALGDRAGIERGERQGERVSAAAIDVERLAARVRDAAIACGVLEALGIDSWGEPDPDDVPTAGLRPADACRHVPPERRQQSGEPCGVEAAHAPDVAVEAMRREERGERG